MYAWQDDFTYFYYMGDRLMSAASMSGVPDEIEVFVRICDAVSFFPGLSLVGKSAHEVTSEYHQLCLDVLKLAVCRHGEAIEIFRGSNSNWALDDHKILYGATDASVAAHYGKVGSFRVLGLRTLSPSRSVLCPEDQYSADEEVVFFPETVLCN
jgi:hypothetical protein